VIRLALRLTVAGGREALTRLIAIVLAVTIGVTLLLVTLAGINAVHAQNDRYAWLETGFTPGAHTPQPGVDPLYWQIIGDLYGNRTIARVDVAPTGPHSPVPPGIPHLPGPGEYYASPAMAKLLRETPPGQLADRYGGHQIGTIADSALPSPDYLAIVIGRTAADLSRSPLADRIAAISTTAPADCTGCPAGIGIDSNGMTLVLSVVALGILFPVLILIATATRLSAARREQRFAAMRLVGATPGQVSLISTVEAGVAALAGALLGFPLFFAVRGAVAAIPFTGAPFFVSDVSLTVLDVLLVVIGVPIAAALAARIALQRVQISPLGVSRRVTPRPPRMYRLLPLVAGLLELGYFTLVGRPVGTDKQTAAYSIGFALVVIGLVVAGPWLTMAAARVVAWRARRPAVLIAGRRLEDNPKAGFRAISGLIVALFVTSVAVGVITTLVAGAGPSAGTAGSATLVRDFFHETPDGHVVDTIPNVPTGVIAQLTAIPGVTGVTVVRERHSPAPRPSRVRFLGSPVSCAQLAHTPGAGRCAPGATVANIDAGLGDPFGRKSTLDKTVWPTSQISLRELSALPVQELIVGTDGSTAAVESARTVLENAYLSRFVPQTIASIEPDQARLLLDYKQLATVVILVSLPIAGCSLAVAVVAGLAERRRPFSLLRLTGVPLRLLRRIVALETVVPLVLTAIVSIGVGFLAADLFLRAQLGQTLVAPGVQYYVIVGIGLIASLAILGSTLPLLARLTGPEASRTD
jgi:hypothetical protein